MTNHQAEQRLGKLRYLESYHDGGTIVIATEQWVFYIDYRIGTKTPGRFFLDYPSEGKMLEQGDLRFLALKKVLPTWIEAKEREALWLKKGLSCLS